jgi:hypothetical protein
VRAAAVTVHGYPAATQRDLPGRAHRLGPIAAQAIGRDWNGCAPEGSPSRLPPSWSFCITPAPLCITMRAAAGTLFTVRTGDERIAPESLTCPKSLFVHHNMSSKRAIEPLPIVKIPNHGRTVKPLCARRGQTQNAFPVNRQKLFLLRGKGANPPAIYPSK